jgi:luciferase family oxidoreductase group 1
MLPHYAPLKVAEQFRVLEALAPGRIDLGVGRAPGSDFRTAQLLSSDPRKSAENFPVQVRELQAWISGIDLPDGHPGHGVTANPTGPTTPELWMLGSSNYGAQLAAHYGLPENVFTVYLGPRWGAIGMSWLSAPAAWAGAPARVMAGKSPDFSPTRRAAVFSGGLGCCDSCQ